LRTKTLIILTVVALVWSGPATQAAGTPEEEIAGIVQVFLAKDFANDYKDDPNPYSMSADVTYAGRHFPVTASGSGSQALAVHLDETGLHARGEDVLGALRVQGFTVQLVRCGLIYTESTHSWYRMTSAKTRPVVLKQSIRREGNQAQDTYMLRLDGTLPSRDPRDRDPGVGGCL
jgi:hypothetical protein